jgi:hypothetical protein
VSVPHVVSNMSCSTHVEGVAMLAIKVAKKAKLNVLSLHHVTLKAL